MIEEKMKLILVELIKTYQYEKLSRKYMINPTEDELKDYWTRRNKTAVMILNALSVL